MGWYPPEIKEIYRIGIILLIHIIIILYDSIHLDFIHNGLSIYNDIFIITSYTKLIEILIFIIAIIYLYIIKEYIYNVNTINKDTYHIHLFGNNPASLPFFKGLLGKII